METKGSSSDEPKTPFLVDDVSDDELENGDDENDECPTIHVSIQEKRRLRSQWSKALIIKLIGHTVGYNFLVKRLKTLWQISSAMDVIDLVKDDGDRNAVMESNEVYGKWMLVKRNPRRNGKQVNEEKSEEQIIRQNYGSRFNALYAIEEEVDNNEEVEIPHNLEENMARKLKGKETVGVSHARKGTKSLNKGETSMMILNAGQNKNKENNQVDPSLEMKSDRAANEGKPKEKGPKVVAAMDHHILVQGNNNNKEIVRTLVTDSTSNTSHAGMVIPITSQPRDHFSDPQFPYPAAPNILIRDGLNVELNDDAKMDEEFEEASSFDKSLEVDILVLLETKINGEKADKVCSRLRFDNWVRVECAGYSGGIWLFWNSTVNIKILQSDPQFLHCAVDD
ncbi:hypothetical protein DITRI_Ditri01bG0023200 [Diplodiscus trichospermus]